MKKISAFLLALCTVLCLTACNNPDQPDNTDETTVPTTKTVYLHSSVTQEYGSSVTRTEYQFDEKDILTDIVIYSGDEETDRYRVQCDENGNATRWSNEETTMECRYDDRGRTLGTTVSMNGAVVSSTTYIWEGDLRTGVTSSGEGFESRHTFTYDEAGHLIRQDIYTNGELTGYSICTNDENGRIVQAINYLSDGSEGSAIRYTYSDSTETRTTTLPDGTVTQKIVLAYDETGNLSTSTTYDGEGSIVSKETHVWRAVEVPIDCPRAPI